MLKNKRDANNLLSKLIELSINGLAEMYNHDANLFCYQYKRSNNGMRNEGLSLRYTLITLLGIHRLESQGKQLAIDIRTALNTVFNNLALINNIGDLGLLLWLSALAAPEKSNKIFFDIDIKNSLNKYRDGHDGKTTELAWLLTGLSYTAMTSDKNPENLEDLALTTYNLLTKNYGGKGIFGHESTISITGFIRGHIGCFADQVYPIYALSKFSQAFKNSEARQIALDCAETICRLQGTFGQWWWHYDSKTAKVIGRYPVYSVHQEGMAPMALFAVSEATGQDFNQPIYKGLEWVTGRNELDFNLIDTSRNVIWRSFYLNKYETLFERIKYLTGLSIIENKYRNIMVLYECRPYELGWLLYAFADKITEGSHR